MKELVCFAIGLAVGVGFMKKNQVIRRVEDRGRPRKTATVRQDPSERHELTTICSWRMERYSAKKPSKEMVRERCDTSEPSLSRLI